MSLFRYVGIHYYSVRLKEWDANEQPSSVGMFISVALHDNNWLLSQSFVTWVNMWFCCICWTDYLILHLMLTCSDLKSNGAFWHHRLWAVTTFMCGWMALCCWTDLSKKFIQVGDVGSGHCWAVAEAPFTLPTTFLLTRILPLSRGGLWFWAVKHAFTCRCLELSSSKPSLKFPLPVHKHTEVSLRWYS